MLNELMNDTKMQDIIDELRIEYLKDQRPFVVLFSTGKDSTLVLTLTWQMLQSLKPEQRHKTVHVICSNTKVETPSFTKFVERSLASIQSTAIAEGLPIEVHYAKPSVKDSFFYQVIGKDNIPPSGSSPFRWCTDKLKLKPVDRVVLEIIEETPLTLTNDRYDAVMLLGVRESESETRKRSIEKFSTHDKYARHAKYDRMLVYHPIKYVETQELWTYLLNMEFLPWGIESLTLYELYRNFQNECPMTSVDNKMHSSCGGGRMGCFVCPMVGKKDKMLTNLIEHGERELIPLLEFKNLMLDMMYDLRHREPLQRNAVKQLLKPPVRNDFQVSLFDDLKEVDAFKRADNWSFQSGPFTLEARRMLLKRLLFAQEQCGSQLISEEELQGILEAWQADGWHCSSYDIVPEEMPYDGPLLLHPDGRLNERTTKNPNPVFALWEDFDQSLDDVYLFLRERALKTGKHIYYFARCVDYKRDFDWTDADAPILNQVQFIICENGITSEEQARAYLEVWLGYNESAETMNWDLLAIRTTLKAQEYVKNPDYDPVVLERMNKTLTRLGYEPVHSPRVAVAV